MTATSPPDGARPSAATPYVLPFAIFVVLTELGRWVPGSVVWIYPVKTLVAAALMWRFRASYPELRWESRHAALAVGVGVLVLGLWIPLSHERLSLATPIAVNAWGLAGAWGWPWVIVRLLGSALVVPVMEELFWRSFLPRYLINPDFERVPLGVFTVSSLLISVALFGVEHNQWVAGVMAGLAYAWLLRHTRSLPACILAHGVTNGLLGAYVLATGAWQFW